MRPVILPLATAGTVLLIWQLVVTAMRIPAVILPPPVEIAVELRRNLPVLLHHAIPTTLDFLMAFALATALGVSLAVAITYSPLLRDTLYPNVVVFQLIPKVALAPLFVVWLGISSEFARRLRCFRQLLSGGDHRQPSASPVQRPRHCASAAR